MQRLQQQHLPLTKMKYLEKATEIFHLTEEVLSRLSWIQFCIHYHRHSTYLACQQNTNYHTFGILCHTSRHAKKAGHKKAKRNRGGQRKRSRRKLESLSPSRRQALPRTCDLTTLAMTAKWLALAEQAPHYPKELSVPCPHKGRLPIHWACCHPSLDVYCLRALIDAAPHTVQAQDAECNTPLHLLLYHATPNQDLLKLLLDAYPSAVTVQDSHGRFPLFNAIDNDLSLETIHLLTVAGHHGVDAITTPCRTLPKPSEKKPIAILRATRFAHYATMRESHRTPLFIAWYNILTNRGGVYTRRRRPCIPMRGKRLEKAMILLKAAYIQKCREEGHPTTQFRFVHAALTLHDFLPTQVIEYAISTQDMQMKECEEGSKRYPLHILARISMSNRTFQQQLVEQVLDAYPQAAEANDWKGQLPFHICLESGKLTTSPIMHALYDQYPEACTSQDGRTGFYPFVLPALARAISNSSDQEEEPVPLVTQSATPPARRRNSFRKDSWENKGKVDQEDLLGLPRIMRRETIQGMSQLGFDPSTLLEAGPNEYERETTMFELLLEAPECIQYALEDLL